MADPVAPTTIDETYGVTDVLANYIIESINKTESPLLEQVPDQRNAVRKEIQYDTLYELRMTIRGSNKPSLTNGALTVGGQAYIIDTIEDAGTYNGLKRYNVTGHAYANCTQVTALS